MYEKKPDNEYYLLQRILHLQKLIQCYKNMKVDTYYSEKELKRLYIAYGNCKYGKEPSADFHFNF